MFMQALQHLKTKTRSKGMPDAFTGSSALRNLFLINKLIHLLCQSNSSYDVFKGKKATRKVLILLLDCNVNI